MKYLKTCVLPLLNHNDRLGHLQPIIATLNSIIKFFREKF